MLKVKHYEMTKTKSLNDLSKWYRKGPFRIIDGLFRIYESIIFIQGKYLCHLLVRQLKVKNIEIFFKSHLF